VGFGKIVNMKEGGQSMKDKTVLVTGASNGVGLATARQLAEMGGRVLLVCRDATRGKLALEVVRKAAKTTAPELLLADLSSQSQISELVENIYRRFGRLDVLINNAGAIFSKRELTEDGIEKTFAVNQLGPFLLTNLLLDLLKSSRTGRVVVVASRTYSSRLEFGNLQSEKGHNFFTAYLRSKLANILFTYELARRLKDSTVTANCLCPGPVRSGFGDNLSGLSAWFPRLMKQIPFMFATPDEGAKTSVYLASSSEVDDVSGTFFINCRPKKTKRVTYDEEVSCRLWETCENLCRKSWGAGGNRIRA
jgi:NAD(P)-dependent dehydrogenase (short-subunit alcohol dehydrogenase family)